MKKWKHIQMKTLIINTQCKNEQKYKNEKWNIKHGKWKWLKTKNIKHEKWKIKNET